ncbi:branched-chain amino acid ABC transporter permease [Bosea sp. (in: a-proteobacteria)]|uniref:branched-chain amino acid ABC transporter permease n=1 Tax=Bosea sp. (in: a-proteobacteria) TaxID=1871050 RepID=UPI0026176FAF|nr:branched-chain amino acid ABC transporter permease [Bosea sp. (in: a-proteobacteria)]MCO5093153.1 branched-chain amino acid ABC transporter permease [Bosea sp. (in: a-proteobacteria)]
MSATSSPAAETAGPAPRRYEPALVSVALMLMVALPFLPVGQYGIHLAVLAMVYAIGAGGLTGLMGYCGQYSLAQGAFLGVGAYTAAALTTKLGLPGYATLPFSISVAALCGILLGIPSLRLSGHFLAITTIAFQVIASLIFSQWYTVTNGQIGIDNIPGMLPAAILDRVQPQVAHYYLVLVLCVLAIWLVRQLLSSRLGRVWLSIQGDELLAKSLGLNTTRAKLTAFALSAGYGGAAGALLAQYMGNTHPAEFTLFTSITLLAMVLIGGRRSVYGAPLGAAILTLMPELLRSSDELRLIIYGLMIIIVCKFAPFGLLGGAIARRSQSRT